MTLNGVIALILRYFTEPDSFGHRVVEDRPIMSAEYRLSLLAKNDPPCSCGNASDGQKPRLRLHFDPSSAISVSTVI